MRQSSPTLTALQGFVKTLTQGCSNPGLKLANAFGVIQTDALPKAFGVIQTDALPKAFSVIQTDALPKAFGVIQTHYPNSLPVLAEWLGYFVFLLDRSRLMP
jgi:hypothetical protein